MHQSFWLVRQNVHTGVIVKCLGENILSELCGRKTVTNLSGLSAGLVSLNNLQILAKFHLLGQLHLPSFFAFFFFLEVIPGIVKIILVSSDT